MFDRLNRLYLNGMLTEKGLTNAVKNRLITEDQFFTIVGKPYSCDEQNG